MQESDPFWDATRPSPFTDEEDGNAAAIEMETLSLHDPDFKTSSLSPPPTAKTKGISRKKRAPSSRVDFGMPSLRCPTCHNRRVQFARYSYTFMLCCISCGYREDYMCKCNDDAEDDSWFM